MNKKILAAVIVVVAVVVGTIGVFAMRKHQDSTKSKTSSSATQGSSGTGANNTNQSTGDTSASSGSSGNATTNSSSANSVNNGTVATSEVSITNFSFSPANITVKAGAAVTWTNNDTAQHTVTVDSGEGPHSQPLNKGDTYTYTFNTAGTFSYHCSFHQDMMGRATVQ